MSGISLNWPSETAGPAAAGGGPAIDFYPRNYNGIDDRGMQFWVRPDGSKQDARQDIVLDSDESGGVYITATNNWGFHFDNASTDSGVPVDFDQWHHVMQTTFELGVVGVMYVDGVAVAAADTTYNAEISTFSVGSNLAGDANFFKGVVDNIEVYVYGDNSANAGPPAGQDYGAFDLATDNAYIAGLNLKPGDVNRDGDVDGDGTGPASSDDVTAFVEGWLTVREVDGVQLADLVSWEAGDLNFDSITDLEDWSILRAYHPDGPSLNLMALLSVPEPSTIALLAIALAGLVVSGWCGRSSRRISPGLVLLTAIALASTGTGWADSTIWNFDGDLAADSGPGELFFFDDPAINGTDPNFLDGGGIGATSTITTFTDTNSDPNVPGIGGVNTRVMSLPQYGQFQGLYLRHNSPAIGYLADRTMMFDLYIPQNSFDLFGFFAFYNSNATNTNDTDAFVRLSNGALETAGGADAPAGTILPDTWHRIALVNDSSKPHNALWVDGVEVAAAPTSYDSFYTADSPGPGDISDPMEGLLLFADNDFETSPGYVSSFLFADEPLTDVQLQAMGGPNAAGIPEPPDPSTLVLFASVDRDSTAVAINNQSVRIVKMAAYSITSGAGN